MLIIEVKFGEVKCKQHLFKSNGLFFSASDHILLFLSNYCFMIDFHFYIYVALSATVFFRCSISKIFN